MRLAIACAVAATLIACNRPEQPAPVPAASQAAPASTVTLPTGYPERPFVRVEFDKLTWRPTEGNTLGGDRKSVV